jgi:hypothetical protein
MRVLLFFLMALLATSQAVAATVPVSGSNLSGIITTTNTFQPIQAQNNGRHGCTIQNNGSHTMWVYFGLIGNASSAASVVLGPGQATYCQFGGGYLLRDAVSITGTTADPFYANFQ